MKSNSFKDLLVWQRACALAVDVYTICSKLPKTEVFGLASQMQRAAISIASNIAEGSKRNSKKEFKHFIAMSQGSSAELETQLLILQKINLRIEENLLQNAIENTNSISKMLYKLSESLTEN